MKQILFAVLLCAALPVAAVCTTYPDGRTYCTSAAECPPGSLWGSSTGRCFPDPDYTPPKYVGCQIGGYLLDYSSNDFFVRAEGNPTPEDRYPDSDWVYGWSPFVAFTYPVENAINPPLSGNWGFLGWQPPVIYGQQCGEGTTHVIMKVTDYNRLIGQ